MWMLQVLFFLPETKEKTLEELDAVFNVPLRVHAKYGRKWVQKQPYSLVRDQEIQRPGHMYYRSNVWDL